MSLRLHESDTVRVSLEDVFTNPDDEDGLDGDAGDSAEKKLRVMIEQTTLGDDINDSVTTIPLAAVSFANTNRKYIMVGSEKMEVTAGWGTDSLTVTRGVKGTTAAAHSSGDAVRLAYDAVGASISVEDNSGSDESSWVDFCLDSGGSPDGNWQSPLSLGNIAYDSYVDIWRRVTVPAATIAQAKQDLILVIDCTIKEYATP